MRSAIYLGLLLIAEKIQYIAESQGVKVKQSKLADDFLSAVFWIFALMDLVEFIIRLKR